MPELGVLPPRYWRNVRYYYRLEGTRCKTCGRIYYPPRIRCVCGSSDMENISLLLSPKFVLECHTTLHSVPVEFEKFKPLGFGLVRAYLPDGQSIRIIAPLTDFLSRDEYEDASGRELEPTFRVVMRDRTYGLVCYGTKFRIRHSRV